MKPLKEDVTIVVYKTTNKTSLIRNREIARHFRKPARHMNAICQMILLKKGVTKARTLEKMKATPQVVTCRNSQNL